MPKRAIRALLACAAILALCLALPACGSKGEEGPTGSVDEFVGTYQLVKGTLEGTEYSTSDAQSNRQSMGDLFLVINEDGTATYNIYGEVIEGTWEESEADGAVTLALDLGGKAYTAKKTSSAPTTDVDGIRISLKDEKGKTSLLLDPIDEDTYATYAEAMDESLSFVGCYRSVAAVVSSSEVDLDGIREEGYDILAKFDGDEGAHSGEVTLYLSSQIYEGTWSCTRVTTTGTVDFGDTAGQFLLLRSDNDIVIDSGESYASSSDDSSSEATTSNTTITLRSVSESDYEEMAATVDATIAADEAEEAAFQEHVASYAGYYQLTTIITSNAEYGLEDIEASNMMTVVQLNDDRTGTFMSWDGESGGDDAISWIPLTAEEAAEQLAGANGQDPYIYYVYAEVAEGETEPAQDAFRIEGDNLVRGGEEAGLTLIYTPLADDEVDEALAKLEQMRADAE